MRIGGLGNKVGTYLHPRVNLDFFLSFQPKVPVVSPCN